MQLKSLFFPIMLGASLLVFVIYIWPEISKIKLINEERMNSENTLKSIEGKKVAVGLLNDQISKAAGDKNILYDFLPNKKVEERIIAGVNYLASDSQVSLLDISLKEIASKSKSIEENQNISPDGSIIDETGENVNVPQKDEALFDEATIKISGDYEKIKLFIDQIQRMALFNKIKSFNIYTKEVVGNNVAGEATPGQMVILADVIVNFGYFKQATINVGSLDNFQSEIDVDTIKTLKEYISQKIASSLPQVGIGDQGKRNPFLP